MIRSSPSLKVRFFLYFLLLLMGCQKEANHSLPNKPPIADAGPNQVLTLPTNSVQLAGKGTDTDGTITSYAWKIKGYQSQKGQEVSYAYQTPIITLSNLQEGIYWCTLTVTDNGGLSHAAETIVKVVSAGCACYPNPCDAFGDPCDPWDY